MLFLTKARLPGRPGASQPDFQRQGGSESQLDDPWAPCLPVADLDT